MDRRRPRSQDSIVTHMNRPFEPLIEMTFALFNLGMAITRVAVESQMVIGMRLAGMAGLWNTRPDEVQRMYAEKPTAMLQSALAGARAMVSGDTPDAVVQAALKPISRRTRANARRLSKRGPRAFI